MKNKSSTVAVIAVTTLLTASAFANTAPLNHPINGTWCSTEKKDSYTLYEDKIKPVIYTKNQFCLTFNTLHTNKDTAVGRFMLTLKKQSMSKKYAGHSMPEKDNPGFVVMYDVGTFSYIKNNQPTIVAVDAIDETITRLTLHGNQLEGTGEEVTDNVNSQEAFSSVFTFAKTTATVPDDFNTRWEKIYKDSRDNKK